MFSDGAIDCSLMPSPRRRLRLLVLLLAAAAVLALGSAVALCEFSVRIPSPFRIPPRTEWADAVASNHGAAWREVEIRAADGAPLRAWLFEPKARNGAVVLILHGVADTRGGTLAHASMLLRHGYTVLAPDSRAHGASGGAIVTFGILERDDVRRWAGWLQTSARPSAVYGLGISLGAAILLQTIDGAEPFRAVVAESPFATFEDIAYDRVGQLTGLGAFGWRGAAALIAEPALLYARARYGLELRSVSPLAAVRRARVPVLLIHGAADDNVYPYHSRLLQAANPRYVELWEAPGSRHVRVLRDHPEEYERRACSWFQNAR